MKYHYRSRVAYRKSLQMDKNAWVQSLNYLSMWVCLLFDSLVLCSYETIRCIRLVCAKFRVGMFIVW